jgi:hypothetical protein
MATHVNLGICELGTGEACFLLQICELDTRDERIDIRGSIGVTTLTQCGGEPLSRDPPALPINHPGSFPATAGFYCLSFEIANVP